MPFVTIFCSASENLHPRFPSSTHDLSTGLAQDGWSLLYGGGSVGLMGVAARAFHAAGGLVTGVIPETLVQREVAYHDADDLIVTDDLYERKRIMIERAAAIIILPGGFGTLDELLEVITIRQLGLGETPLFFLNVDGFFDPLFTYFEHMREQGVVPDHYRDYYQVFENPDPLRERLKPLLSNAQSG